MNRGAVRKTLLRLDDHEWPLVDNAREPLGQDIVRGTQNHSHADPLGETLNAEARVIYDGRLVGPTIEHQNERLLLIDVVIVRPGAGLDN
jgi:hypothetical protein